jgi:hypothetical protein
MEQPLEAVTGGQAGDIVTVSYVRSSDGNTRSYRCRIDGDRVVWANMDGRWRDGSNDAILRHSVGTHSLAVSETLAGEVLASELYPLESLQND